MRKNLDQNTANRTAFYLIYSRSFNWRTNRSDLLTGHEKQSKIKTSSVKNRLTKNFRLVSRNCDSIFTVTDERNRSESIQKKPREKRAGKPLCFPFDTKFKRTTKRIRFSSQKLTRFKAIASETLDSGNDKYIWIRCDRIRTTIREL